MENIVIGEDCSFEALFQKIEEAPDFIFHKFDYKELGSVLALSPKFVNGMRKCLISGEKSYSEIVYSVLQEWVRINGRNATLEELYGALQTCGWSKIVAYLETHFKIHTCTTHTPSMSHETSLVNPRVCGRITFYPNELLGQGSFGTMVYMGKWEQRNVAVKEIKLITHKSTDTRIESELNTLLDCDDHDNVVKYYCKEVVSGLVPLVYLALQLCDGTLAQWVRKQDMFAPAKLQPFNVLLQITKGLAHLHGSGIIHRDIKPDNILLKKISAGDIRVKISDFGISRRIPPDRTSVTLKTYSGTAGWKAPEILELESKQMSENGTGTLTAVMSRANDIFSLGCVFYYVLTGGCHPFGDNQVMIPANVLQYKPQIQAKKLDTFYLGALRLVFMMIAKEPRQRPSAAAILDHHIFWPKKTSLQFLIDVSNLQEKVLVGTTLDTCCVEIEHSPLLLPYCEFEGASGLPGWCHFLCPTLKDFANGNGKRKKRYDVELVQDLLRLIRNVQNHYSSQSAEVVKALGALPDAFLDYWMGRFPFLIDSVWMTFEKMKGDSQGILRSYYRENFDFNDFDIPPEQEKTLEEFVKSQCFQCAFKNTFPNGVLQ